MSTTLSTTAAPSLPAEQRVPDPLTIFSFVWVGQMLLHHLMIYYSWFQFKRPIDLAVGLAMLGLIVVALLKPSCLIRFSLLIAVAVARAIDGMPNHANHDFFTLCVNVTILATLLWQAVASRGRLFTSAAVRDPLYRKIAALVGIELLTMYFFVVLHKLNHDYLNPDVSCGVIMYRECVAYLPFMPTGDWTRPFTIAGSLINEASIPLLLFFRKTRLFGIALGLMFHTLLSFHPNMFVYDYSSMLLALYVLFIPGDIRASAMSHVLRSPVGRLLSSFTRLRVQLVAAGVVAGLGVVAGGLMAAKVLTRDRLIDGLHAVVPNVSRGMWFVVAITAAYLFLSAVYRVRIKRAERGHRDVDLDVPHGMFRPAFSPLLVFPLLVLFNGFTPYLGLKTESAFAMFANIHTEGGRNNHLFMPFIPLTNYQDVIEVIGSSNKGLAESTKDNFALTYFDFRRRVSRQTKPDFWVTFRRNGGEPVTITAASNGDSEYFKPFPYLTTKLLHFRAVQVEGAQICQH